MLVKKNSLELNSSASAKRADFHPLVCSCSSTHQELLQLHSGLQTILMTHFAPGLSSVSSPFFYILLFPPLRTYNFLFSIGKCCKEELWDLISFCTSSGISLGFFRWNIWAVTNLSFAFGLTIHFPSTMLFTHTCVSSVVLLSKDPPFLRWFGLYQWHGGLSGRVSYSETQLGT